MKRFLELIPIPLAGIMLAIISLGNILQAICSNMLNLPNLGYLIHMFCFTIGTILIIIYALKIIICFKMVIEMLENPEMFGTFSCFSMTIMIWAGYLTDITGNLSAEIIWWFGVLLHYTCMIIFTYKFVFHFNLPSLMPPWYVIYVGFALSGFSAKNFAPGWFGKAAFWVGLVGFWVIFFMLIKRIRVSPLPRMYEPTLCINAALGIILTSYVRNFDNPWPIVVYGLFIIEFLIWIWILFNLPKWLRLPFYPSDAAFSFPLVVTAISSMETMMFSMKNGFMLSEFLKPLILIQTLVALVLTILVIIRFSRYMIHAMKNKSLPKRMMAMNMMKVSRNMDMSEGMNTKAIGKAMKMNLS